MKVAVLGHPFNYVIQVIGLVFSNNILLVFFPVSFWNAPRTRLHGVQEFELQRHVAVDINTPFQFRGKYKSSMHE